MKHQLLAILLFGVCVSASPSLKAETLPAPDKDTYSATEVQAERFRFAGKIIKVEFNRLYNVKKTGEGLYAGNLRSSVNPDSSSTYTDACGLQVQFSHKGYYLFSEFIPETGIERVSPGPEWLGLMAKSDQGEVYLQIPTNSKLPALALGDKYTKSNEPDRGEYKWKKDRQGPVLEDDQEMSASDLFLFPNQVNGKTVEVEFYNTEALQQKTATTCSIYIDCGVGHDSVYVKFPPGGKEFFEKTIKKGGSTQNHIYATVHVNKRGIVTLDAKGTRFSKSKGEYRW